MEENETSHRVITVTQFFSFATRLCLFQSHYKWVLPLSLLVLAGAFELVSFQMMFILGHFYESMVEEDFEGFERTLIYAGLLIFATSMVKSIRTYVCDACALDWRESLVSWVHTHQMQIVGHGKKVGLENIDQRATQDLEELTTGTALLLNDVVTTPFTIVVYSVYLSIKLNWSVPVACGLYFVFGALVSTYLSKALVALTYLQERCEGFFRSAQISYILNFEAIRFLRGSVFEQEIFDGVFGKLVQNRYAVIRQKLRVNMFSNWFDLMGAIVNYAVVGAAILYSQGGKPNGENSSSAGVVSMFATGSYACLNLIHACSTVVDCIQRVAILIGLAHRVSELCAPILCVPTADADDGIQIGDIEHRGTGIALTQNHNFGTNINLSDENEERNLLLNIHEMNVTIRHDSSSIDSHQDNKILIKKLSLQLFRGMRVLVTGKSGCGKSSLLKSIAAHALENCDTSHLMSSVPTVAFRFSPAKLSICSQSPYCFRGSLVANLMYPNLQSCTDAYPRFELSVLHVLESLNMKEFIPYLNSIPTNNQQSSTDNGGYATARDQTFNPHGSDQSSKSKSEEVLSEPLLARGQISTTDARYFERDWGSVCSLGEQQQICLARLLLQQPIVALLDEVTAALDEENESLVYAAVIASCDTFISVGHRSSIRRFHTHELCIAKDSEWTFRPI